MGKGRRTILRRPPRGPLPDSAFIIHHSAFTATAQGAPMSAPSETVRIFDTTLRDGEQSPGATLTLPEKLEIARQLEALGVDIIEAGFPIASNGDFESVKAIGAEITKSVVCGLARSTPKDIERAGEAVKGAAHPRIHIFCATSKIHRDFKLKKGKEDIIRISVEAIQQALE